MGHVPEIKNDWSIDNVQRRRSDVRTNKCVRTKYFGYENIIVLNTHLAASDLLQFSVVLNDGIIFLYIFARYKLYCRDSYGL